MKGLITAMAVSSGLLAIFCAMDDMRGGALIMGFMSSVWFGIREHME